MSSLAITRAVLAAQVNNAGTVVIPYPAGTTQASLIGSTGGELVLNDNDRYVQAVSGVRVEFTFNAGDITVTNETGVAWPIASTILVSFGSSDYEGRYTTGIAVAPALVPLAVSVGTASNTIVDVGAAFNQTTLNNVVRSLAAKVNELVTKMKDAGIDIR
jgi:hypothetical protein